MLEPQAGVPMSRQAFMAGHGASDADLAAVAEFAQTHHLTVTDTNPSGRTVELSGTVAAFGEAFGAELAQYATADDEQYRGRDGYIAVPEGIHEIVEGVFGLDNRTIGGRNAGDPPNTKLLTVPQVARLYNFPANSAAGQTIGILLMGGGYKPADITRFFSTRGLTAPTITDVGIDGGSNSPGSNLSYDSEAVQDICIACAVAQKANAAVYFANRTQKGWVDAITRAVHPKAGDPTPSVISISWFIVRGDDPGALAAEGVSTAELNAVSAALKDAATLGITVLVTSGDRGSDCKVGDGKAHVEYPGSDPWATSCGGTTVGNVSGSTFTEVAWNDTFSFPNVSGTGATGGGVSDFFALPDYQRSANVPASVRPGGKLGRGVPDIAANASPNSGYDIWVNGSTVSHGGNGTSAVAPLYAGLIAVCNATLGQNVGFLNPLLYALNGTGVIRDIADGGTNALNGAPGYTAGAGWDACTGLGVIDGTALLTALQARFTKDVTIVTDRSTFGMDEITAMLTVSSPAVINDAFYVTVDGFTPAQLGITSASPTTTQLEAWAPRFTTAPTVSGMSISPTGFKPELPSLPAQPQRFTFTYRVAFTDTTGFTANVLPVTLTASTHGVIGEAAVLVTGQAAIELIENSNPFMVDGPVSWLSTDLRVFQIHPGDSLVGLSGVSMGSTPADASTFIKAVVKGFNELGSINHPFDLISTDENTSRLELSEKVNNVPVFNFAVCRVRIRGFASATDVRVFFRLFQASTTAMAFDPNTTYLSSVSGGAKIPLLGLAGGAVETIPCFADLRVDTSSTSMADQRDPTNVQTFVVDGTGNEQDFYFGCWLDINQPLALVCPPNPPNATGPFSSGRQSVQQMVRALHQCLVAEIVYDPDPIPNGASPGSSDKLAQRNLAIVASDNPGTSASHRTATTFDVEATSPTLPHGWHPDELLIDWGATPPGSEAQIHLSGTDADEVLALSATAYGYTTLRKVDDHTLATTTGAVTWLPLPTGFGPHYTGLLTVDLPATIKRGQSFKAVVKQITSGGVKRPPVLGISSLKTDPPQEGRRTRGSFQLTIPVSTKVNLLPDEERAYSALRWIQSTAPAHDRWGGPFDRYVSIVGERVRAFGGDPGQIAPSPDGSGVPGQPNYVKEPPDCRSEILFVGTTGLNRTNSAEVPVEMYIDILAPESYKTILFETASLYIDILTRGVKIVPHPTVNPGGDWAVWDGTQWKVTSPASRPPTDRLRVTHHNARVTSGGTNGLTHWLGLTGLPNNGALEIRAYCDATKAGTSTQSCKIHIKDLHVGQRLPGFLD
ncbi:S53 family peptidase [Streptomyces sp. NPDC055692]|uniref:S53 family peptidase n=1 Tax=Streptomyces sp. NPDC055692 TaxID=3155683 RepID=UPI00341DF311